MESDASAKSLLALFSSSNLKTFAPATSRTVYGASGSAGVSKEGDGEEVPMEQPKKRRRRNANAGEWSQAEIRVLETYKSIIERDNVSGELRAILLPNRSEEEINAQLRKLGSSTGKAKRTKLQELEKEEAEEFEKDSEWRKEELDKILGLGMHKGDEGANNCAGNGDCDREEKPSVGRHDTSSVKASLDRFLGLVPEPMDEKEKRRRALDQALGLTWT